MKGAPLNLGLRIAPVHLVGSVETEVYDSQRWFQFSK